MPPWPADPHIRNSPTIDRCLLRKSRSLAAWADTGAKEGDQSDAPAPRKWTEGWNISKPDLVIQMPNAFEVPAKGEVEYQYIVIPSGFTEDKWVQQVEVRPSDRTVVHHAVVYLREPGSKWMADAKPGVPLRAAESDSLRPLRQRAGREQRCVDSLYSRHGSRYL